MSAGPGNREPASEPFAGRLSRHLSLVGLQATGVFAIAAVLALVEACADVASIVSGSPDDHAPEGNCPALEPYLGT